MVVENGFEYTMDTTGHDAGDEQCGGCWDDSWPRKCDCGGLVHAEFFEADWDNYYLTKQCDRCGTEYLCDEED